MFSISYFGDPEEKNSISNTCQAWVSMDNKSRGISELYNYKPERWCHSFWAILYYHKSQMIVDKLLVTWHKEDWDDFIDYWNSEEVADKPA